MKEETIISTLGCSYFNQLQREVEPFFEYFNFNILMESLNNIKNEKNKVDYDLLEKIFFMACLHSQDICLPFNYSGKKELEKIKKKDWLVDLKSFGSKSKQGVVNKCLMFDSFYIVIKKAKSSRFNEITCRDFCVGIGLNKILTEAPFFVHTLGCFDYKNQFYIATEFVDGINLKSFLQNKTSTFKDFINIFFQILLGLEIAQNKLNFSHYDLHTDNVILVPQHNQSLQVLLYGRLYTIKYQFKPVMIDFGLSSIHTKGHTVGQNSLESKGIFNHLSPGYDIYIFLLFCVDVVQTSNIPIFKGIMDLLTFFNVETQIPMEVLTNNHIKSLKKGVSHLIPNQFIEYILQNYFDILEVNMEVKKYHTCLGQKPSFLKLKKIFDVKDELSIEHKPKNKICIGYLQTLVNNIKIYYWYKDKITLKPDEINRLISKDEINLQNLIDDLNLKIGNPEPKVTVEQKKIFFLALDYYYLILELELHKGYLFYYKWMKDFKETFTFKNIFHQINYVLKEERVNRFLKEN